jgi:hypothetical protein
VAANVQPRLHGPVRLPILPRGPDEQGDQDHDRHEHQENENDRGRNVHADIIAASGRRQRQPSSEAGCANAGFAGSDAMATCVRPRLHDDPHDYRLIHEYNLAA